jgi:hypothetical protein
MGMGHACQCSITNAALHFNRKIIGNDFASCWHIEMILAGIVQHGTIGASNTAIEIVL